MMAGIVVHKKLNFYGSVKKQESVHDFACFAAEMIIEHRQR